MKEHEHRYVAVANITRIDEASTVTVLLSSQHLSGQ